MPEISIIIPLYNKGKYIARALDSVFAQSFQNFEIIVVNDGSIDEGPEIVNKYSDKRLRLINQDNAGPGAARNKGITESKAAYLAFLDADDEWLPDFLESSLENLNNNPDCDLTICSYYLGQNRIDYWKHYLPDVHKVGKWQLTANMKTHHLNEIMLSSYTCAFVCKRKVIEKYGGFYSLNKCTFGEDWYLWLQIVLNHKIYLNTKPMVWYHYEVSEQAHDGFIKKPFEPMFIDTEPIRKNCPFRHLALLEHWLARHALQVAHLRAANGQSKDAFYLANLFPLMQSWRWEYLKLRTKMFLPQFIPVIRYFKQYVKK